MRTSAPGPASGRDAGVRRGWGRLYSLDRASGARGRELSLRQSGRESGILEPTFSNIGSYRSNAMRHSLYHEYRTHHPHENYTLGGLLVYAAVAPALVALLATTALLPT
jgi:hypothetical protein